MAKPAPGHAYNISGLNVIFGISSIALFVTTIWMVWDDYAREWKQYQRGFRALELAKSEEALAALEASDVGGLEVELQAQVDAALARMQERQDELATAEREDRSKHGENGSYHNCVVVIVSRPWRPVRLWTRARQ